MYMKTISITLMLIILPNFFWGALAWYLDLDRTIINIDYFVIFLIIRYRFLFIPCFFIINLFDFINLFSQVFAFIRFSDLLYLIKFIVVSSLFNLLYLVVFLIFFIIYLLIIFKNKKNINYLYVLFVLNLSLLVVFLANNNVIKNRYAESQIYSLYENRSKGFFENFHQEGNAFDENDKIGSAASKILKESNDYTNIILVLNESWGVVDDDIQKDIISPLKLSKNGFDYSFTSMDSNGFTLDAEIRELCQKGINHFNMKNQMVGFENCLPHILNKKGYETISYHGSTGFMYDRKYWYPRVGFKEINFKENFLNKNSRCYSFPGMCDVDLGRVIHNRLKGSEKKFIYWLTLNTHFRYDLRDMKYDLFDCKEFNVKINSLECNNLKLQKQFFHILSMIINTKDLKNTYIIVVGDHPPPMYGAGEKIFEINKVPVLQIKVR